MTISGALSEQVKIQIIQNVDIYGRSWSYIGNIMNRNPDAIRSFYNSYLEHKAISPKKERPAKSNSLIMDGVLGSFQAYPQNLANLANDFEISTTTAKSILNTNSIKFFDKTPITPLT